MTQPEFIALMIKLHPGAKFVLDEGVRLGKVADAVAVHCFVTNLTGADVDQFKAFYKQYLESGEFAFTFPDEDDTATHLAHCAVDLMVMHDAKIEPDKFRVGVPSILTECYFCSNKDCTCVHPEGNPGFTFQGKQIIWPNKDISGRFFVNPEIYYGESYRKWSKGE